MPREPLLKGLLRQASRIMMLTALPAKSICFMTVVAETAAKSTSASLLITASIGMR